MSEIVIGDRTIGEGHPVLIVAELSANHQHDLDVALATIDAAADAGADAVKLQTYTPDTLTYPSDAPPFQISGGTVWDGRTLYDLYAEAYMPWEWHGPIFERAAERGVVCFSTPFDPTAVDLLASLDAPAYKIASMEINDVPLIDLAARQGRPIILSTGVATEQEIAVAVQTCRDAGNDDIIVLKCTSAYPAPLEDLNLRTLLDMPGRFGAMVGLSDHTTSHIAATTSVALGAALIEKHLILDRSAGGPDSSFSMEPDDFAEMVRLVRDTETALGRVSYDLAPDAEASRRHIRSLFVVADVAAGDPVTAENVRSIRPADGLPPADLPALLGRTFVRAVPGGTALDWDLVD